MDETHLSARRRSRIALASDEGIQTIASCPTGRHSLGAVSSTEGIPMGRSSLRRAEGVVTR
jgi:hypothetical protein